MLARRQARVLYPSLGPTLCRSARGWAARRAAQRANTRQTEPASSAAEGLAASVRNSCLVVPSVLSEHLASTARQHYDGLFADGRNTQERHFGFDLWHIEGSFTAFRTPAADFFGSELWASLEASLAAFGRRELGCQAITPPWLSVYLDGCEQRLHTDVWYALLAR
jgi:hypothetical protein